ncbi:MULTISPECIES: VPLPA-CTERM sorting domain-containing protein [Haematobacter]|uniref:PEP-CTERM sorting domain-containing protein n=2 Tax=Haematobacter TaxID=366614 RepID=A0A212AEP8_9RHOB|nr:MULTISPECIES: VPLPA-CTERM sorting domain-containing protein [Haematobacter]OWJ79920.1 PEP-CTERM sorting domain-containing protein [Haematobacter genomosp. 1]
MKLALMGACALAMSTLMAQATTLTVYDGVKAGKQKFDATVAAADGVVKNDVLDDLPYASDSIDRGDYTITKNDGGTLYSTTYGTLSGQVLGISPAGTGPGLGAFGSGITFTFKDKVNAFGFEVGDWATCCFLPTNLYISFDGGAPILVGSALDPSEGQFPSQDGNGSIVYEIFVAAFDDTGSFGTVSFWGDGFGEYLVAGGQVKYALLDEGSLPPPSAVPLPAAGLLLMGGIAAAAGLRLRRR